MTITTILELIQAEPEVLSAVIIILQAIQKAQQNKPNG